MLNRKHRLLSLFMVFAMALAMLPLSTITALAAWDGSVEISDWYGDGTATDYYIGTAAELAGLAVVVNGTAVEVDGFTGPGDNFVGKTVTLTSDIDLSGTDWTPIGSFSLQFSGTFDGDGKTITGLTIGSPSSPDNTRNTLGLFGAVAITAVIQDTDVEDVTIYSDFGSDSEWAFIGGLAGYSVGAITGCHSTGSITGGYKSKAGGLVGYLGDSGGNGTISDCYSACDVASYHGGSPVGASAAGGLAGYNERAEITGSHATGDVTCADGVIPGNYADAGGFVGTNYLGTISDCDATGSVTAGNYNIAGGFSGYNDGPISGCHAEGMVTGGANSMVGGFTGINIPTGSDPNILNCFATGDAVSGDSTADNALSYAGGFVGRNTGGIKDCYATGDAAAGSAAANDNDSQFAVYAGGFAAYSDSFSAALSNCRAAGTATAGDATVSDAYTESEAAAYAGGFAGYIGSMPVDNCHSLGDAEAGALSLAGTDNTGGVYAGGFAGYVYGYYFSGGTHGTVTNSWSGGNAAADAGAVVGGFAGESHAENRWSYGSYTIIANSYATGDVVGSSSADIGGFVGRNYYGAVQNCYGAGLVTPGGSTNAGGFAGNNEDYGGIALIENVYYNDTLNAALNGTGVNTGTAAVAGLSAGVMQGASGSVTYETGSGPATAANFVNALNGGIGLLDDDIASYRIWQADSSSSPANGGYPLFEESWQDSGNAASSFAGGDGSALTPYQISSGAQLAYLAKLLNDSSTYNSYKALHYVLTADINLGGYQWVPIGKSSSYGFEGVFDGGRHLISGMTVGTAGAGDTTLDETGLFGYVNSGAEINNVGVSVFIHSSAGSSTGGLAGVSYGTIMNCWVTGSVKSTNGSYVGGLIGESDGAIQNCYVRGSVEGGDWAAVGGLAGFNNGGTIQNCYASADITGGNSAYVGGLIGGDSSGELQNDYYDGDAAQMVNGSAQSPKLGTGIEVGTMTGSVTELSSADMKDAGFVDTLNEGISLFGSPSLYSAWYADSSTSPVNGGYPVFSAPPVPSTANAANNTVSASPVSITAGETATITAAGDRQSAAGAVTGDERYVPTTWVSTEAGKNGTFTVTGGVYTSDYAPSAAGSYTITATFQKQSWDGSAWNNVSGSTDTKTTALTVNSSANGNDGSGSSGGSRSGNTAAAATSQTGPGSVTIENGAATATVDSAKLAEEISANKPGSTIVFAITGNVNKAGFNLTVADLKAIAENGSMLQLESSLGIYKLPAAEIDFDAISKQYPNISAKDIKVTVMFSIADGNNAILNGLNLVGQPINITVNLVAGNKRTELDEFTKYVERDLPVPDGSEFTTGVVIETDGTLHPVPTKTVIINGKKYAAIFSRTNSVYALAFKPVNFDDMKGHWAKEAINDLASRLVINGVENNIFAPDRDITRAEFAAIVVKALGLKAPDNPAFTDVKAGSWYYDAVAAAYKYGIISGYDDGTFKPENKITRQEAMAMAARAMMTAGMDTVISEEATAAELAVFIDGKNFSAWARQSAAAVIRGGLATGSEGYARPEKNITRAEAAVIVRRLLEKAGLI